jgi:hypothetical protein
MASTMKEHPILFSAEMVRAILDGRKTQTRRVCKDPLGPSMMDDCPYGEAGDFMWVRESFLPDPPIDGSWSGDIEWNGCGRPLRGVPIGYQFPEWVIYRATWTGSDDMKWHPSIHMPRWASRITLEIKSVRVERIRDIGHRDIAAEGVGWYDPQESTPFSYGQHKKEFEMLWDKINAKRGYGWDVNPWVWVIEFQRSENQTLGRDPEGSNQEPQG